MKKTIRIVAFAMVALMLMLALVSCGAKPKSDPDKAVQALKDNGIVLALNDKYAQPLTYKALGVNGVTSVVSGAGTTTDGEVATVYVVYFESSSAANDAFDSVKDYANTQSIEGLVVGKSGSMIYFGNEAGIKAAS